MDNYKRIEKLSNSHYKTIEFLLQLKDSTCLIYNKNFVQYNGTGQTFLTDLRSKNTLLYPQFSKKKKNKVNKTKTKKGNFSVSHSVDLSYSLSWLMI